MKLCYHIPPKSPNFGDELNVWLWEQLIPDILDDDESVAFVGIGTLLNSLLPDRIPNARRVIIFGSGAGYNTPLEAIDDSWTIYCVRGPLSAKALGLSPELALTDGAALIRRLYKPTAAKVHRFSYMPHFTQSESGNKVWPSICQQIGFGYIDARWPRERVLEAISQTEVLLTEAMHGAIIADALRVPWIPICTTSRVLSFKWQDWSASVGLEYRPSQLSLPFNWQDRLLTIGTELKPKDPEDVNFLTDLSPKAGSRTSFRYWLHTRRVGAQLKKIAKTARPNLSNDAHIERLTVQLEERLDKFKADVAAGYFQEQKR